MKGPERDHVHRCRGIAQPPAEAHVEDREQEGEGRRRAEPHVGARRGAGDGKSATQGKRHRLAAVAWLAIFGSAGAAVAVSHDALVQLAGLLSVADFEAAEERRQHERGRFAFLPGELLAGHQVERRVDDRQWPRCGGVEAAELDVVVLVETGERLAQSPTLLGVDRSTEIGAHQTVAVEAVHRELVDVDAKGQKATEDEQSRAETDQQPETVVGGGDQKIQMSLVEPDQPARRTPQLIFSAASCAASAIRRAFSCSWIW